MLAAGDWRRVSNSPLLISCHLAHWGQSTVSDKIKRFSILILLLANGCAFSSSKQTPGSAVTVEAFREDTVRYPDAATAHIQTVGEVTLDASIDRVYEFVLDLSYGPKQNLPSGATVSVDHSKSDAGLDQWGIGSAVQFRNGNHTAVAAIDSCQRPNLVITKALHERNGQTARATTVHELKEVDGNKTNLTVSQYATLSEKVSATWISDWTRERSMKKSLSQLVEVFNGQVLRVESQVNNDVAPVH